MCMMKRMLALLLFFALLLPSAVAEETLRGYDRKDGYVYVTFGSYPQTEDGTRLPILWRVLQVIYHIPA